MRYLFMAVAVLGLGLGCATPKVIVVSPVSDDVDQWRLRYQQECERTEALAVRLAEVESALESVKQERAESARLTRQLMQDELDRAAAERHSLVEHNAQLVTRQRELTAIQDELEDVWFQSALSRARRRSQPQPGPVPAPTPELTPPARPAPSGPP